jgi:hypothetical protein
MAYNESQMGPLLGPQMGPPGAADGAYGNTRVYFRNIDFSLTKAGVEQ